MVIDTLLENESSIELVPLYGEVVSGWHPPYYLDCIDCQSPTASPASFISYSVELTDEFDCIHEEVFTIDVPMKVPNVITPNGDGYNDCLQVMGIPLDSELHVFEKNGEFLGKIPLNHFADKVKIFGDRLYILEKDNEMCVYEYRIAEIKQN